jgi:hypothetical protein
MDDGELAKLDVVMGKRGAGRNQRKAAEAKDTAVHVQGLHK